MDQNVLHYVIHVLLGVLGAVLGWLRLSDTDKNKKLEERMDTLEHELNEHKIYDSSEFSKLNTKSDDVARRLESIEAKLDRLLEKR